MSNIHEGVSCDMCMKSNFSGKRYKCLLCYDFDLCSNCHEQSQSGTQATAKPPLAHTNTNHNHLSTHPMQCILTKSDFELFYGVSNGLNDYGEQLSFTCPYCGKLGFSESTLCDHLSNQHLNNVQNENLAVEVVCPICAALPTGSDPNHLTEDLLHHIHLEHLNNRNLLDSDNLMTSNSHAAAAALRFSRRLNYAQNAASLNRGSTGAGGSSLTANRNNTFRFQFGNTSSGGANTLSSFMRSASSTIDAFGGSTGASGSNDPIVELLSQLTGVRRAAANANTATLTLAQLTRERESLQQQSAAVARHHHHLFSGGGTGGSNSSTNKLGLSAKANLSGQATNNSNNANNNINNNNNQSQSISSTANQLTNQFISQILDLPANVFLQPLPPNSRDPKFLLSK